MLWKAKFIRLLQSCRELSGTGAGWVPTAPVYSTSRTWLCGLGRGTGLRTAPSLQGLPPWGLQERKPPGTCQEARHT